VRDLSELKDDELPTVIHAIESAMVDRDQLAEEPF